MKSFNRKSVKRLAAKNTADKRAYQEVFLHSLVVMGAGLLIMALDYILQQQIGGTGGLSGIGTRTLLETARTVLQYANMLLVPFWQMGIFYWAIRRARRKETQLSDFLEGFRRFGPVLRLKLLQGIVVGLIFVVAILLSSVIFAVSPLAWPVMKLLLPYTQDAEGMQTLMMNEALMAQIEAQMYPVYIILAILLIPALLPLFYRFRMAEYVIMDKKGTGAILALIRSFQMTRKQSGRMIKLDLSHWWYLALQLVAEVLLYIELLLPLIGVAPPQGVPLLLLNYGGYYGVLLIVYTLFRGRVETTYALVYNILNASVPEPKPLVIPDRTPWVGQ